jgi:DNA mismatch repair ATPase MutS
MQPLLSQLELTLRELLQAHQQLSVHLELHVSAIRSCDPTQIERAAREQDAVRAKIVQIESRRRFITHQITRNARRTQAMTLEQLAEMYPDRKPILLQLRQELRDRIKQIQQKSEFVAKVAGNVLGHLNATVRLIANAASGPGTYTKSGAAPIQARVGVLSVVG